MAGDVAAICRDCLWTGTVAVSRCPVCGSRRLVLHAELASLCIAHLDCDAFYASVEKRDRPEWRDRPVIVGGGRRGVVTTACYIARLSGVRSAMPMFKALQLCPDAVIVKPNFSKYRTESQNIFSKLRALTPLVQTMSLDEAWMDLSGTERLHGSPPALTLTRLQREIEDEVGLSVSIGLAANKFLAKVASEMDKPRGFAVIGAAGAQAYLAPLPNSILPGVGPVLARKLAAIGLRTIGDIAAADPADLASRFGAQALRLQTLAKGQDDKPVDPNPQRKSLSAETTFESDLKDLDALESRLWVLCEKVIRQARAQDIAGCTVTLKLRTTDFRIHTRRRAPAEAVRTAKSLFATARSMLAEEVRGRPYRLIGVGLADLVTGASAAGLFADPEGRALREETAIDDLRRRFGDSVVVRARSLRS